MAGKIGRFTGGLAIGRKMRTAMTACSGNSGIAGIAGLSVRQKRQKKFLPAKVEEKLIYRPLRYRTATLPFLPATI